MEHSFLVEEYIPAQVQRAPEASREFGTHIPEPEAAAALPPLPNLPASEELLLTPAGAGMSESFDEPKTFARWGTPSALWSATRTS